MRSIFKYLVFILLATSLEAASIKEVENKIDVLEEKNAYLRQELAMEEEASRLLGQKLLKAYEEKVVVEDRLKEREKEIKRLEKELTSVRKMMEKEVASYRKKLASLYKKSSFKAYIKSLEEEKKELQKKLALKEKEVERAFAAIAILNEELASKGKITARDKSPVTKPVGEAIPRISTRKILSISKKYNFVIIGCEDTDAIDIGKVFSVFRGNKKIGEVKVNKMRNKYVFAGILNTVPGEEIKEGDTAR